MMTIQLCYQPCHLLFFLSNTDIEQQLLVHSYFFLIHDTPWWTTIQTSIATLQPCHERLIATTHYLLFKILLVVYRLLPDHICLFLLFPCLLLTHLDPLLHMKLVLFQLLPLCCVLVYQLLTQCHPQVLVNFHLLELSLFFLNPLPKSFLLLIFINTLLQLPLGQILVFNHCISHSVDSHRHLLLPSCPLISPLLMLQLLHFS